MRTALAAALFMFSSVGFVALAAADQPYEKSANTPYEKNVEPVSGVQAGDARSVASDQDVGVARRAYRAQCLRYESAGFCECVTAGVAQALSPADVRLAARTIRERIGAQGDAADSSQTDQVSPDTDPMTRVAQVEGYYASACRENLRQ